MLETLSKINDIDLELRDMEPNGIFVSKTAGRRAMD